MAPSPKSKIQLKGKCPSDWAFTETEKGIICENSKTGESYLLVSIDEFNKLIGASNA